MENYQLDPMIESIGKEIISNLNDGGSGEGSLITNCGDFNVSDFVLTEDDLSKLDEALVEMR